MDKRKSDKSLSQGSAKRRKRDLLEIMEAKMMHPIITDYWGIFLWNWVVEPSVLEIWEHCKYWKCSSELKLFDGRTLRIIRTHPEELKLSEVWWWKYGFWTLSEKVVGVHEIIKLTLQICFGNRYDHYKHSRNIMRHYFNEKKFYLKNQNLKFWKFFFEIPNFHHFFQRP